MGQIRIFNRPPKAFEFDKEDLVIDNVRGDIYYKDEKNRLQKIIRADDTSTSLSIADLTTSKILTGDITASGNISASGIVIANAFQSDGEQQITVADSFNITGSVTSSGDISASGIVIANEANIIGNITSSGNISSSGTIIGSNLSGTNTGDQSLVHLAVTGSNVIFANITASGNISSSGTIEADKFTSDGKNAIENSGAAIVVGNQTDFPVKIGRGGTTNIELRGPVTASTNISSSQASTISGGTGSFRRLLLGDTNVAALSADFHIRNAGSVNVNLDSFDQNGNQIINFLNNQEPDFSIGNYFSDGGFQIRSDQKSFAKFGADDGDIIALSGSVHVTGSNGHIITDGNISASGTITMLTASIGGGIFTSASLASAQSSGDNLGNHTATQNLSLGNFDITSSKNIIGITGSFNQTVVTLKAGAQDSPFLIKIADSNGQDNKLEVTKDGILKFGALDTLPTAITGGLAYSASAFYAGL